MLVCTNLWGQPIPGVWRGQVKKAGGLMVKNHKLELHVQIENDSLKGVCFFYEGNGRVYNAADIAGYVDPSDGTVHWWFLDAESSGRQVPFEFSADLNCPGEDRIQLDGIAKDVQGHAYEFHLIKVASPLVKLDETPTRPLPDSQATPTVALKASPSKEVTPKPAAQEKTRPVATVPATPLRSVEDMYRQRERKSVTEIQVRGDSVRLDFYDHAEIDGDSISLFLNGKLIYTHILLKATPFTLYLAVASLQEENELTMVAENLGSIPPNTSLMIAYVQDQRHEARLESTENSSASVRLIKPPVGSQTFRDP